MLLKYVFRGCREFAFELIRLLSWIRPSKDGIIWCAIISFHHVFVLILVVSISVKMPIGISVSITVVRLRPLLG
jgi:hypothetical protein